MRISNLQQQIFNIEINIKNFSFEICNEFETRFEYPYYFFNLIKLATERYANLQKTLNVIFYLSVQPNIKYFCKLPIFGPYTCREFSHIWKKWVVAWLFVHYILKPKTRGSLTSNQCFSALPYSRPYRTLFDTKNLSTLTFHVNVQELYNKDLKHTHERLKKAGEKTPITDTEFRDAQTFLRSANFLC